jgi:putative DNA methylase
MSYPKRLIEVDLPIARISAHARREKSIRHGHISTLHIWWARRPLAACRAVICASLWPDPADPNCPPGFREAAVVALSAFARRVNPERITAEMRQLRETLCDESRARWEGIASGKLTFDASSPADMVVLRIALLDFIADFANWDNSTVPAYLETSRALTQAAHEALGGAPGTRPLVVDPFCGGGSIPLEALRVGADSFASDLNPVPVLINKMVLEYIPRYGQRLADEVRKWGEWTKTEAEKELGEFYPKDEDGATPIAYLWARTIKCEGPACGAEVPLVHSLWLAKKSSRLVALQLVPNLDTKRVEFQIITKQPNGWFDQLHPKHQVSSPKFDGTLKRSSATCPCCGYTTPAENVRQQVKAQGGGADAATLLTVLVDHPKLRRVFRLPKETDYDPITRAKRSLEILNKRLHIIGDFSAVPDEELPYLRSIFNVQLIGVVTWGRLFAARQQLSLATLASVISKVDKELLKANYDHGLAKAIQIGLALVFGKLADRCNAFARWEPNVQCSQQIYGRQALGIVWDFGELAPLRDGAGSWTSLLNVWLSGLPNLIEGHLGEANTGTAHAEQIDATKHQLPNDSTQLIVTDPPYYDAVPYADLSDFFYVWLKRMVGKTLPDLFREHLTPKMEEIVQLAERNQKYASKTKENFEQRMQMALAECRRLTVPSGLSVIVFAHKATSAWETMLQAVIGAGWTIVGSWPIDTEMATRLRALNSATLSSSVHLVCRPRENADGSVAELLGEWRDVLGELPKRIHEWMPRLAAEGVVGADAIFACLGPALEIFSRYSHVEKANGETATLREYLEHVWAAVSTEALSLIFKDANAAGLEPDARLTAMWLWTIGGSGASENEKPASTGDEDADVEEATNDDDEESTGAGKTKVAGGFVLDYDAARKIAQGLGIHLEQSESLVEVKGDKARLLPVAERTTYLFGKGTTATTSGTGRKKKPKQRSLFEELDEVEAAEGGWIDLKGPPPGTTVLDRVHQAMILFAGNRGELLKRFLVEDGVGKDDRFWKLADNLNKLYPPGTEERRWVEGVLARKKGLGL